MISCLLIENRVGGKIREEKRYMVAKVSNIAVIAMEESEGHLDIANAVINGMELGFVLRKKH